MSVLGVSLYLTHAMAAGLRGNQQALPSNRPDGGGGPQLICYASPGCLEMLESTMRTFLPAKISDAVQ